MYATVYGVRTKKVGKTMGLSQINVKGTSLSELLIPKLKDNLRK